ncbi:hypothetical protein DWB85_07710 [Seongchinamella sediminis]|uniref:MotA/TolQ/ExbB proton channel family protein n=1 Tax=Seongchinamella sediminis TaxID=2283635 RepID=A0A3L7E0P6_9GAMM|nr:hypothetical protein [Seongchinamella sediminis]RLQ22495.1 hypothetical protein DWB85_07710 [Seongchinamella sediminis]
MSVGKGSLHFVLASLLAFGLTLACLLALARLEPGLLAVFDAHRQALAGLWQFAARNLQGSIPLFVLVLLAYVWQMVGLGQLFQRRRPPVDQVMRKEQLLDLCASLFFGIGVIWTAIGMRGALLFALGDTAQVAPDSGSAVLQRLVEGGILLALSTTIVGGVGGYLMRAGKQLVYGRELALLYLDTSMGGSAGPQTTPSARGQAEPAVEQTGP